MRYYKIFKDDKFIGIARSLNYLTYQEQNNLLVITDEDKGQFVEYNGQLYRDTWMKPLPSRQYSYIEAIVREIEKDEYDALAASIEKDEEIKIEAPAPIPVSIVVAQAADVSLDYVKENKIKELSYDCNKAIEDGVEVELPDSGKTAHFSLSTQDQLNLLSAEMALNGGADEVQYRADGETFFSFYSENDMRAIIDAVNEHKRKCLLKYHVLKNQVEKSEDISEISKIKYLTTAD